MGMTTQQITIGRTQYTATSKKRDGEVKWALTGKRGAQWTCIRNVHSGLLYPMTFAATRTLERVVLSDKSGRLEVVA